MNERIQELRIQACTWASENAPMDQYENAADKKFAELIVKECVLEAMDAIHHNTSIRTRLYKHFGVE